MGATLSKSVYELVLLLKWFVNRVRGDGGEINLWTIQKALAFFKALKIDSLLKSVAE